MTRAAATALFAFVALAAALSFWLAPRFSLWLPAHATSIGPEVDRLFYAILVLIGLAFVTTQVVLVASVWRYARGRAGHASFQHGNPRLEIVWTAIPAVLLVVLAFAQLSTWNSIRAQPATFEPLARVDAFQFGWRFLHAGRDGRLDTQDDVPASFELLVPRGEVVWLELVSRDVIHSFFVPSFRLKQDVVPGMAIPIWFEAREQGQFDLICAELCGWGHYKMAGRVRAVSRDEYDAWIAQREREIASNGQDEAR